MLTVALFSYIFSLQTGVSSARLINNFYSSLFHDLPEILTKDIVRPIKSSVEGLEDIIKLYEEKQINEKVLPLLPAEWHTQMKYFIQDEFSDKIIENGVIKKVENAAEFDDDKYNAVDGTLVEICDKLCAYIEASMALEYGIKSTILINSKAALYEKYSKKNKGNINFKEIFDYFHGK
jgi:putative hydrolase of HD superfamily